MCRKLYSLSNLFLAHTYSHLLTSYNTYSHLRGLRDLEGVSSLVRSYLFLILRQYKTITLPFHRNNFHTRITAQVVAQACDIYIQVT